MSIKRKILTAIIALSLGALSLLSLITIVSILSVRLTTLKNGNAIVEDAVRESQINMEAQIELQLTALAHEKARLLDEKFQAIRNQTLMTAGIAERIYTNPSQYRPRDIAYLTDANKSSTNAHLLTAPGVSYRSIANEARLAANISDILQQSILLDAGIVSAYIGSESGFLIASDKAASSYDSTNFDVTKRAWYVGAKKHGDIFWTEVFIDAGGRGEAISCAMPFYDNSGSEPVFKGVAACGALLDDVRAIMDSVKISENSYVFLMNHSKKMVMGSRQLQNSSLFTNEGFIDDENYNVRELGRRMVSGESGFIKIILNDETMYAAFGPLSTGNLSMGLVMNAVSIEEPIRQMRSDILIRTQNEIQRIDTSFLITLTLIIVVILSTTVAAFSVGRALSNSLTAPIMLLHKEAEIISGGDLNHELTVVSDDEIGSLAAAFNKMIRSVKDTTSEKERINNELFLAAEIQTNLLPKVSPLFSDCRSFDLFAKVASAKEVCGDFYDFYYIDSEKTKLACLVADVSGKGVPAALFTLIAKILFKLNLTHGHGPSKTLSAVNKILCEDNPNTMFVTAFICVINLETGMMEYANAGHNPPLLSLSDTPYKFIEMKTGMLLGISEDAVYDLCKCELHAGDRLYMYTDGVNETVDNDMNEFGNERLLEKANEHRRLPPEKFDNAIRHELKVFMNGAEQADDITTVALKYNGPALLNVSGAASSAGVLKNEKDDEFAKAISVPASAGSFSMLDDWLDKVLHDCAYPEEIHNRLMMVNEEIFMNIASYAYPDTSGNVTVRASKNGSMFTLRYEDAGIPFNPLDLSDPDISAPLEDRTIGGLGVYLTRKMMDDVEYTRVGNKNVLILYKFIV
ncbi:MAG: SpoIIE family protein phosphatase [Spirochaetaceae bacterium]|jgi:sigma-B regulation protein RsbU (phosphoserine phosphatase)|nr:SpoIIE family protein phosphatase [Spirochaetaceae bacterium]